MEVAKVAAEGLARAQLSNIIQQVQDAMWQPVCPHIVVRQEVRAR